ncbi:MAG TPA: hypothetical protein VIG29_15820 [Vicinamibacteria bacterium]
MALTFILVLERDIPGCEPRNFDGARLARVRHDLDAIAHEQDLRGLGEFVAFSQKEAETLAEDMKFDAPTVGAQTGRWFPAVEGLRVVHAIREYLLANPDELDDADAIAIELGALEAMLAAAQGESVRFRLSLDY